MGYRAIVAAAAERLTEGKVSEHKLPSDNELVVSVTEKLGNITLAKILVGDMLLATIEPTHGSLRLPQPIGEYVTMEINFSQVYFSIEYQNEEKTLIFSCTASKNPDCYAQEWMNSEGIYVEIKWGKYVIFASRAKPTFNQSSNFARCRITRTIADSGVRVIYDNSGTPLKFEFIIDLDSFLGIVHGRKYEILPHANDDPSRDPNIQRLQCNPRFDHNSAKVKDIIRHLIYLQKLTEREGNVRFIPGSHFSPQCYLRKDWKEFLKIINLTCELILKSDWRLTEVTAEQGEGPCSKIMWSKKNAFTTPLHCYEPSSELAEFHAFPDRITTDLVSYENGCVFVLTELLWPKFTEINFGSCPQSGNQRNTASKKTWQMGQSLLGRMIGLGTQLQEEKKDRAVLEENYSLMSTTFPNLHKTHQLRDLLKRPISLAELTRENQRAGLNSHGDFLAKKESKDSERKALFCGCNSVFNRSQRPTVVGQGTPHNIAQLKQRKINK